MFFDLFDSIVLVTRTLLQVLLLLKKLFFKYPKKRFKCDLIGLIREHHVIKCYHVLCVLHMYCTVKQVYFLF